MSISREEFLRWEATTRDVIDVKCIYIDIAEDIVTGVFLSQLLYWNTPDKKGNPTKTRISFHGKDWVVCKKSEWWDQCRLTQRQVDKSISILKKKNIIEVATKKFQGIPQLHIHLNFDTFYKKWQDILSIPNTPPKYKTYRKKPDKLEETVDNSGKHRLVQSLPTTPNGVVHYTKPCTLYNIDFNIDSKEKAIAKAIPSEEGEAKENAMQNYIDITSEFSPEENDILVNFAQILSGKNIYKCIKTAFLNYDNEIVLKVMQDICSRYHSGLIDYLTPQYFINALEQEGDMPEVVLTEFKKFCLEKFGHDEYMDVVRFYTNTLKSNFDSKASKHSKGINLTKRRINNIDSLLKDPGKGTFMKAMKRYLELFESGRLGYEPSIERFSRFVEKFNVTKFNQPKLVLIQPIERKNIVPKPYERYQFDQMNPSTTPESEATNWSYQCECGAVIENYLDLRCKNCEAELDWANFDYSIFKKGAVSI